MDDAPPTDGSVAADHEELPGLRRAISPTTHASWRGGTLRIVPKPVACWRIHHAYFRFDSSVILPDIAGELERLKPLVREDRIATIFGHADPVGNAEYNAHLSARRARALYGLLTRNIDIWLELFSPKDYDAWGLASTQTMLSTLPTGSGQGAYYSGEVDGRFGPLTDDAIRRFQGDQGLTADGIAGATTRRRLYELYIDALTGAPGQPLMRADQFVGDAEDNGRPKGKAKGAMQGCGEHNPILLLSKQDEARYARSQDKAERNERNAPNRRAILFLFRRTDFGPTPQNAVGLAWPCPAWDEGPAACAAHLWRDHKARLTPGEAERRYEKGETTMACAWYERFSRRSPCEGRPGLVLPSSSTDHPFSL